METGLTERQIEVIRHVANGRTNAEIGHLLGISEHTVKTHLNKVRARTGCPTRVGLAVMYVTELWPADAREKWLQTQSARAFMQAVRRLTRRQLEVLDLLADNPNLTNIELASRLYVSEDTIRTHIHKIAVVCDIYGDGGRVILAAWRRATRDEPS